MILIRSPDDYGGDAAQPAPNPRFGVWNSALIAARHLYSGVVAGVSFALPNVNEVPEDFPAKVFGSFASLCSADS